jgi:hypothetical protein
MSGKRCPSCGETKAAAGFGRNQSLGDGLSFYCLESNRAESNAHYRKRRQAMGKQVRDHSWVPEGFRWSTGCEQALAEKNFGQSSHTTSGFSSWCKACRSVANSDGYFCRRYKLTRQELSDLRDAQDNRCAICDEPDPQTSITIIRPAGSGGCCASDATTG